MKREKKIVEEKKQPNINDELNENKVVAFRVATWNRILPH